ncbi:Protein of unknown function [Pyronema omphalodes CBS 100304]|uniref:Uncharacterized protein n=1 Tax=Pyronema omphalodes (strain CBS 100304) TaxID=1076935 RepID=U4KVE7_PYROM|nr:Protein of unknown function [Pyronema omphalodes CBS 100304]
MASPAHNSDVHLGSFVGCFLSVKCRYLQTPQSGIPPGTHTSHGVSSLFTIYHSPDHLLTQLTGPSLAPSDYAGLG